MLNSEQMRFFFFS